MTVILSTSHTGGLFDSYLVDKEAILCSLNIKAMRFPDTNINNDDFENILKTKLESTSHHDCDFVPMITELSVNTSVQFLDRDDAESNV